MTLQISNSEPSFDLEKDQYRMIGTDRVTRMTIGGRTYRSASAQ